MQYEIIPCVDGDAEYIEEQADQATNTIAPPAEGVQEEVFIYQVTDPEGCFLGGCILVTEEWKTAIIVDLWVEEAYRHQGIASALIRESERKARERGCYLMLIGTFDFQAKPLYDKHGYALIETMTDYPKGHEHYFLQKRLDRPDGEAAPSDLGSYKITLAGEEIAEELSDKLNRHDEACVPREHADISICKKAIDENGKLIAGILGGVDGWDNPDIDALWVDESCRRQGIGSALLRAFEQEAKEKGAYRLAIEPFDWNVGFFRKNGYEKVTGVLEDYPKGHTLYCMEKPL